MSLAYIQEDSKRVLNFWRQNAAAWAPADNAGLIKNARLDWLMDLTDALSIWCSKGTRMSNGELILAYANLGTLIEGWLKLFYCVYDHDYKNDPKAERDKKKGTLVPPGELKFEKLKVFSRNKIWGDSADAWDMWVQKIQNRRNAIHAFNTRDIGTPAEYISDVERFDAFLKRIDIQMTYPDDFPGYDDPALYWQRNSAK